MCQRLHRRYQDEGRDVEIGDADLMTMGLEIISKKCASVLHGIDIFEPPGAWNLFVQDAVKLRIDAVSIDRRHNEFARRDLNGAGGDLEKGLADHLRQFLRVALDDGRDQRPPCSGNTGRGEPMLTPATAAILLVLAWS